MIKRFWNALLALIGLVGLTACTNGPLPVAEQPSASSSPAYMIVLGTVHNREAFLAEYSAKLPPLYEKYGGEYIALGGGPMIEVLEGDYAPPSFVIGKWASLEAARAFWNSPEYDVLRRARIDNDWGDLDVLLVQGLAEVDPN